MNRRAAIAAVILALALPVVAHGASEHSKRGEGPRVPSAQLQVTGSGAMTVTGRMVVNGSIPSRGRVTLIDRAGDAKAYLAGTRLEFRRGRLTVRRASGILYVTGSGVSVQVRGVHLSFSVAGNGVARLAGSGRYRLNAGPVRAWSGDVIRVSPAGERDDDRRGARRRAPAPRPR